MVKLSWLYIPSNQHDETRKHVILKSDYGVFYIRIHFAVIIQSNYSLLQ